MRQILEARITGRSSLAGLMRTGRPHEGFRGFSASVAAGRSNSQPSDWLWRVQVVAVRMGSGAAWSEPTLWRRNDHRSEMRESRLDA